jgi:UPF0755 protein
MRRFLRVLLTLVLMVILVTIIGIGTVYILNQPSEKVARKVSFFSVKKGETLGMVAGRLKEEELVRSALLFQGIGRLKGTEQNIKVGKYRIEKNSSALTIHDLLVSGKQLLERITIPEGWTMSRIAEKLEELHITTAGAFLEVCNDQGFLRDYGIAADTAEGYLFPETYSFPEEHDPRLVAEKLVETTFETIAEVYPDYKNLDKETLHKKVIVASIVEREYRIMDEAPLIASVFYNRLRVNVGLDSCATVEYIITEKQNKPHPTYLTYEDLEIESPYNTYKYAGLPPGPICNPGKTALHAAFYPADSDYWYFLLKDPKTGEHYFSKDIDEHNQARRLFLKRLP